MFLEREYRVAQERRRDTLAWAEKERLILKIRASTRAGRTSLRPFGGLRISATLRKRYQRWMARLGAQLIRWGSHLQARYADTLIAASAIESSTSPLVSR